MCVPCIIGIVLAFVVGLVLLCSRCVRWVGVFLTVAAVCAAGYAVALDRRYQRSFLLIAAGDSVQRVRDLLARLIALPMARRVSMDILVPHLRFGVTSLRSIGITAFMLRMFGRCHSTESGRLLTYELISP